MFRHKPPKVTLVTPPSSSNSNNINHSSPSVSTPSTIPNSNLNPNPNPSPNPNQTNQQQQQQQQQQNQQQPVHEKHSFHPLHAFHPLHVFHPPHIRVRPPWRRNHNNNSNLQRSDSARTESDDISIAPNTSVSDSPSSTNLPLNSNHSHHHHEHHNPFRGLRRIAGHLFKEPDRTEEDLRSTKRRIVQVRRQLDNAPIRFTLGFRSRTGWEPIRATRENQDCLVALIPWGPDSKYYLFAALDGHGRYGHVCAIFIAQRVVAFLSRVLPKNPEKHHIAHALHRAMLYAEKRLENPATPHKFDASGSTGVFVLIHSTTLYCANVGDSRAVIGREKPKAYISTSSNDNNDYHSKRADTWSEPHHPNQIDLSQRVPSDHYSRSTDSDHSQHMHQSFDAIQTTTRSQLQQQSYHVDHNQNQSYGSYNRHNRQFSHHNNRNRQNQNQNHRHHQNGYNKQVRRPPCKYIPVPVSFDHKPIRKDEKERLLATGARVEHWDVTSSDGDERVWLPDQRTPGLAVTRSFGDVMLKKYGVCADPEIYALDISTDDRFLVMASDGIFEFLSNQEVVDIVGKWRYNGTAQEAAQELVKIATDRWVKDDSVIDDISCVVVFMDVLNPTVSSPCQPFFLRGTASSNEDQQTYSDMDSSPRSQGLNRFNQETNSNDPDHSNGTDISSGEFVIREGSTTNLKELEDAVRQLQASDPEFDLSHSSFGESSGLRSAANITGDTTDIGATETHRSDHSLLFDDKPNDSTK